MDLRFVKLCLVATCILTSSLACPGVRDVCSCETRASELRYRCDVNGTRFIVDAVVNLYVVLHCLSGNFSADLMPSLPLSRGEDLSSPLSSVTLRGCPPIQLMVLIKRWGAMGLNTLMLVGQSGPLGVDQVEGLDGVSDIILMDAAHQPSVPYDVISSLPSLRSFRLHGATVPLSSTSFIPLQMLELSSDAIRELKPGVFKNMENLTELYLWGNKIEEVNPGAFVGLSSLKTLDLSRNPLRELSPHALSGAPLLSHLYIDATHLAKLRTGALSDTPLLGEIKLNLGINQLTLEDRSLSNLHQLKNVSLSRTSLTALPSKLFTNSRGIERIDLSQCNLTSLPETLFQHQKNLVFLNLNRNRITKIPEGLFDNLITLKHLDLSDNGIQELQENIFVGLSRLLDFKLDRNQIVTVSDDAFTGLINLQNLSMSHNRLSFKRREKDEVLSQQRDNFLRKRQTVQTGVMAEETNLSQHRDGILRNKRQSIQRSGILKDKRLSQHGDRVSRNKRESIQRDVNAEDKTLSQQRSKFSRNKRHSFQRVLIEEDTKMSYQRVEENCSPLVGLTKLVRLDLSGNAIDVIFDDWREPLYSLQYIDLSWNSIRMLRKNDLEFRSLQVDLRHNLISTIEISQNLRLTTILLLGHNPYNCDCHLYPLLNYVRTHKTALDFENASCNSPEYLNNTSLQNIALTSLICPVYNCPEDCICSLEPSASLLYLDCKTAPKTYPEPAQYNVISIKLKLHSLNTSLLRIPSDVTALNLSGIGLTEAPALPETLKEIDLSFNQLATIPRAISSLNATLYIAGNPIQCLCENKEDIEALLKRSDEIADGHEVSCVNGGPLLSVIPSNLCNVWWSGVVGGTFAVFGFAMAVLAIFVYNYSEEIKRFIYEQGWNLFIYEEEIDGRKTDVLLSYGDEEEKFVVQEFVPELKKRGYTVQARYEDWDIGVFIPDKVVETVDESRRVVVIWTKDYLNSVANMEWKVAQIAQVGQKRKRLLVIVKDEVNAEYLKEYKCLKWEHSSFWEKLEMELPKRRKECEEKISQATLNVLMTAEGKVAFARNKVR